MSMRKYNQKPNVSGKLIEEVRISKNMSREDLAKEMQLMGINVDRSFVYRIENQEVIIKDFELIVICKILGIDIKKLEEQL